MTVLEGLQARAEVEAKELGERHGEIGVAVCVDGELADIELLVADDPLDGGAGLALVVEHERLDPGTPAQKVYVGDEITVVFADGSSVKLQFLGSSAANGSIKFKWVYGSERDKNGKKIGSNTTTTTPNSISGGSASGTFLFWANGWTIVPVSDPLPRGQVVVLPLDPNSGASMSPIINSFDALGTGDWFGGNK